MKKTSTHKHPSNHHDHSAEKKRLNRIQGQIDGIQKMMEEHRYCPEIMMQVRAVRAALRSLESSIMERHLRGCVTAAMKAKETHDAETKIRELIQLFGQMKD
ncbi:MAG: metal-sensitive transcriptional regulator [Deltaproteobacteria bacterium]|nr:metal-sensitive transcriptional regulator [Deltaproteobacteria bacterium]